MKSPKYHYPMRTIKAFAVLISAAVFILSACELLTSPAAEEKFELNKTTLEFSAEEEEMTISLLATSDWNAEITKGKKWLKADPMDGTGSAERQKITVRVSSNEANESRSGEITFTMEGGHTLTLDVAQEGIEEAELSISAKSLEFGYESSTQSVKLTANQEWSVSIGDDLDWIAVTPEKGKGKDETQEIGISVVTNTRGSRAAKITFTCGSESEILEIYQSAPLAPGNYFIGACVDNSYSVAKSFIATYGYLQNEKSRIDDGFLGYADNVFTFSCTEEGYAIQDCYGMYLCCEDGYSDFARLEDVSEQGGTWTVLPNADGTYTVTNWHFGGSIQFRVNSAKYGVIWPGDTSGTNITLTEAKTIEERPVEDVDISAVIYGEDGYYYRCTGYVGDITNTTYGNFYLKDYSGELYVYGTLDKFGNSKNFLSLGIEEGDIVTVSGPKLTYGTMTELVDVTVENIIKVTDVSIQDFLYQEVSDKYYRLTGTITSITNTTYGNFYITDSSGATVYVYGLVSGYNGPSKQFAELNLKEGDEVTIVGNRYLYGTTDEVKNAFYVSHISK